MKLQLMNPTQKTLRLLILCLGLLIIQSCQSSQPSISNSNRSSEPPAVARPLFSGVIKNVSMYPVPGQPDNLAISLVVSVENVGADSVANGWNLEVSSPNIQNQKQLEPVRVNGVVELPGTKKTVDLAREDLALKTADSPIAKSKQVEGVLTFVLPQASERAMNSNSTSLILHFKDGAGNPYQTPKAVIGRKLAESK